MVNLINIWEIVTVNMEIRFFQSIKIIPRTRKKTIFDSTIVFWFKMFFESKCFFAFNSKSARPDSQKAFPFRKNNFRSEMDHFGPFWSIWAHFGSISVGNVFRFKMFSESKCFFAFNSKSARPDSQKSNLIWKQFWFRNVFERKYISGSKNKKPYFRTQCNGIQKRAKSSLKGEMFYEMMKCYFRNEEMQLSKWRNGQSAFLRFEGFHSFISKVAFLHFASSIFSFRK